MGRNEALETARLLIALRDAIREAGAWEEVAEGLEERGVRLEDIRARLRPRIEFDPHCHTVYSDGQFTYEQLLWWCKATGLKGLAVTDHDNIHPSVGDAIEAGEALGVRLVPGVEITIHRLGGQAWSGLEVGMHFFPARAFADFIRSEAGSAFCRRFEAITRAKSEQGWGCLEAVNEKLMVPKGMAPISREEFWDISGGVDPVLPGSLTLSVLEHVLESGRPELLREFPNTREIYTYIQKNGLAPPMSAPPQTFDDIVDIREELASHGIRSTVTLNHPEEWLTKCGLTLADGSPDAPAIRRLVLLMLLHAPDRAPVSFIELYSPRNTPATRRLFESLLGEFRVLQEAYLPGLAPLQPIASTDSHRVQGSLDERGEVQGWVPGEDFIFGVGAIDEAHPTGNLDVPENYPCAEEVLALMESRAT